MKLRYKTGFTLVELLIVIVVIAILAAISVVAYNGIQDRARTTSGHQLASDIAKKAEMYNTLKSEYAPSKQYLIMADPDHATVPLSPPEARPDDPNAIINLNAAAPTDETYGKTAADNGTKIAYRACPSGSFTIPRTGGIVYYWDYVNDQRAEVTFGSGC